ncbi:uncharacterized protein SETTUDRAFT_138651 [Exserohilum turcica Et28A]|uniref:AMP-dependent synthetase/ligase domain-containing protein n=1 Tax=Exserohilum turcicum (strain 28A) TaxID=671987 RepID=R0IF93_EXST2|nr:uncharacterized protein SETTUDRAFT_138651 [Exserohilum turcica Et28A]EOA83950.1 hypothetical protein SETTUDRAFT_138651 [Exserohilum turcica Et28A]
MSPRPTPWPQFHGELLPNIVFRLAAQHPSLTYAKFPRDPGDMSRGFRTFTYAELARAVSAFAWWIDENVGKLEEGQKNGSETLVYMGPNDIRYAVFCLGSVVAGYKMLFPSPRYGAEALVKLLETVGATALLTSESPYPVQAEILERKSLQTHSVPSVEELFSRDEVERYPFSKTFAEHKHEPLICLHTSGTTGFPKPILWTHEWASSLSGTVRLPPPAGFKSTDWLLRGKNGQGNANVLVVYPPYHASGITSMLFLALFLGIIPIYPTMGSTPEEVVDRVIAALDYLANGENATDDEEKVVDMINMVPPHIEVLAKYPARLEQIARRTTGVRYGGGAISRATGDKVVQKVALICGLGSTEQGFWPCVRRVDDDLKDDGIWEYSMPHPALNMRLDPVSKDAAGQLVCDAVLVRNDGKAWDGYVQPLFRLFPADVREKNMGDLFVQHPKYPNMWKHHGRADDLLVFVTNEKFFPTAAEHRLRSHPGIAEALIVGTRRPKASLLVRLEPGVGLDDVWGGIEEVNADSPVYARVERGMVVVVNKPFLKTPKGSVRRTEMVKKYTKELDALYGESEK